MRLLQRPNPLRRKYRNFRSRMCFKNHKQITTKRKSVCERRRCCETCGVLMTSDKHVHKKRFCVICKQKREVGHLCYMRLLTDVLPANDDKVLYVFHDFETTQHTWYSIKAKVHVTNLVCVEQFCTRCEEVEDCGVCVHCSKRRHPFWDDPVGTR